MLSIIEKAEERIDKSTGAIYIETMATGKKRHICGYCWEKWMWEIHIIKSNCK